MTAVTAFPLCAEMQARLAARETAVTCSRAILRSAAQHDREDVRLACHTLMTYGEGWDWAEAYPVLRALDAKPVQVKPVAIDRPPYSQGHGTIRRLIVGTAVLVGAVWAMLVGVMV
jgi:hypothetical protein